MVNRNTRAGWFLFHLSADFKIWSKVGTKNIALGLRAKKFEQLNLSFVLHQPNTLSRLIVKGCGGINGQ